jgi:hypothetical protein
MVNEIIKLAMDSLVEIGVLALLSFGSIAVNKVKSYLKAKTTDKQYETMAKISKDVYDYVEREFGDKLQEKGQDKLARAMQVFDAQMAKHNLPYSAVDFKMQVEKIIKQEKDKGQG